MALNRCEQMESRWNRCAVSRGSQEMVVYKATQLHQELTACAVDGAQRFDSHRDKIVSGRKVRIIASFSVPSVLCCVSRRYRQQVDIGGRARVNGCCVPSNILAPRPGNESSSVRSFAVISDQAWWFLRA